MENYRMNGCGCRPYRSTCGMNGPRANAACNPCAESARTSCMYDSIDALPLAMAYVPRQVFSDTFQLSYGLCAGTIFPDLCKPFCGRGGMCR